LDEHDNLHNIDNARGQITHKRITAADRDDLSSSTIWMRYGLDHRDKHCRHDGKEAGHVDKHDGHHRLLLPSDMPQLRRPPPAD
jgi:hypothetical protein